MRALTGRQLFDGYTRFDAKLIAHVLLAEGRQATAIDGWLFWKLTSQCTEGGVQWFEAYELKPHRDVLGRPFGVHFREQGAQLLVVHNEFDWIYYLTPKKLGPFSTILRRIQSLPDTLSLLVGSWLSISSPDVTCWMLLSSRRLTNFGNRKDTPPLPGSSPNLYRGDRVNSWLEISQISSGLHQKSTMRESGIS